MAHQGSVAVILACLSSYLGDSRFKEYLHDGPRILLTKSVTHSSFGLSNLTLRFEWKNCPIKPSKSLRNKLQPTLHGSFALFRQPTTLNTGVQGWISMGHEGTCATRISKFKLANDLSSVLSSLLRHSVDTDSKGFLGRRIE